MVKILLVFLVIIFVYEQSSAQKSEVNIRLFLQKQDPDVKSKYHLPETFSPEYALTKDCNYDLLLLKWGCQTLIHINEKYNLKDSLVSQWTEVFKNLTHFQPIPPRCA